MTTPPPSPDAVERFLSLSSALTGYDAASLHATGMVGTYWSTMTSVLGGRIVGELLSAWDEVLASAGGLPDRIQAGLRERVLTDPDLGPVAGNLVVMWYVGQWTQMPRAWRDRHGASAADQTRVISAEAYREGLVWHAIGAHPMGAKQQGFGAWGMPPRGTHALPPEGPFDG